MREYDMPQVKKDTSKADVHVMNQIYWMVGFVMGCFASPWIVWVWNHWNEMQHGLTYLLLMGMGD